MGERRQLDLFGAPPPAADERAARAGHGVRPAAVGEHVRAVAARLSPAVRLGTSSWSFPGWAGIVYQHAASPTRLARDGLAAYARHPLLRTVGIDRTFYAPIAARDFSAYAEAVPDDFRFLVKAHELCTIARFPHQPRYGAHAGMRNDRFLDAAYAADLVVGPLVDGLGDKTGVLLFQFPPQDVRALGGPDRFAERLHAFLAQLPRGPLYAVELRNAELLTLTYADALMAARACHCFNVHPSMPALPAQASIFEAAAPAIVVRWMLGHGQAYAAARDRYAPFDRIVDADPRSLADIAALCARSAHTGRPAYVVINNKAEGSAPLSAVRLAEAIVTRQ